MFWTGSKEAGLASGGAMKTNSMVLGFDTECSFEGVVLLDSQRCNAQTGRDCYDRLENGLPKIQSLPTRHAYTRCSGTKERRNAPASVCGDDRGGERWRIKTGRQAPLTVLAGLSAAARESRLAYSNICHWCREARKLAKCNRLANRYAELNGRFINPCRCRFP